jgi:hypothetical protein
LGLALDIAIRLDLQAERRSYGLADAPRSGLGPAHPGGALRSAGHYVQPIVRAVEAGDNPGDLAALNEAKVFTIVWNNMDVECRLARALN